MDNRRLIVGDSVIMDKDWYDWTEGDTRVGRTGEITRVTSSRYTITWYNHYPISTEDGPWVTLPSNQFHKYFKYYLQVIPKYDKNKRFTLLMQEEQQET